MHKGKKTDVEKRRIKKGLDKKVGEGAWGSDQVRWVGSTPPKTGKEGPSPSHVSPTPTPAWLAEHVSHTSFPFPLLRVSVFIPLRPEKVPNIHRESLVIWHLELAPEQKLL